MKMQDKEEIISEIGNLLNDMKKSNFNFSDDAHVTMLNFILKHTLYALIDIRDILIIIMKRG